MPDVRSPELAHVEARRIRAGAIEEHAPQTDDELHALILERYGMDVPRTAACEGCDAPFAAFADLYFGRVESAAWLAPRGGAKTWMAAVWHKLSSLFFPGCESLTFAATLAQSRRCYQHLLDLIGKDGSGGVDTKLKSETRFANGSKVEIVSGTEAAVRGPHPQHVHGDELDTMQPGVFAASRGMSLSKPGIPAVDLITGTRERRGGPMDKLVREYEEDVAAEREPARRLYRWCIYDTTERVANCQRAKANEGRPHTELCDCHLVRKGTWEAGRSRTFADCCGGKLSRSAGWRPLSEVRRKFQENEREVWESEYECRRPSTRENVLPDFSRDRHGVVGVKHLTDVGNVYCGIDFGGRAHHHAVWILVLHEEVEWGTPDGETRLLKAGTRVAFDEAYRAGIGYGELAELLKRKEAFWAGHFPGFRVSYRWGDAQGTGALLELKAHNYFTGPSSKDQRGQISHFRDLVNDDLFAVEVNRCALLVEQLEGWSYQAGTEQPVRGEHAFDHGADATRYGLWGIRSLDPVAKQARYAQSVGHAGSELPSQTGAGASPWETATRGDFNPERDSMVQDYRERMGWLMGGPGE
jgi:hypothetical protein